MPWTDVTCDGDAGGYIPSLLDLDNGSTIEDGDIVTIETNNVFDYNLVSIGAHGGVPASRS